MKSIILFFSFLLTSVCTFGQTKFLKGYFINTESKKTECLIRSMEGKINPIEFQYKTDENGPIIKGEIDSISAFEIYGNCKFIRAKVKIDRSGYRISELTTDRNPEWVEEKIFLKVISEAKATLFVYEDGEIIRYFYSVLDSPIQQLVFKKYLIDKDKIGYNYQFRQQLWMDVRCSNSSMSSMESINYDQKDLMKYFEKYNQSNGNATKKYGDNSNKNLINFKITPGINISSLKLANPITGVNILNIAGDANFRLGLESEFLLSYLKNKWAIVFEPTFQYLKSEQESETFPTTIQFNSIDFPIGLRHLFVLNEHSKIFLNGFYISRLSVNFNSSIHNSTYPISEITTGASYAVGGGFNYKKISLEARFYTKRNLLKSYSYWKTDYSRFSFIIGYKLSK
ncbi:MAG: hypothetical protein NTZ69_14670 [Bacteroidia bacterium]|nr:hypothetical protein [Bacteroidia bacterium]